MRSKDEHTRVMALAAGGLNDSDISRRTGIPRSTVRDWRSGTGKPRRAMGGQLCGGECETVERARLFADDYVYLLGQYLGDGHLSELRGHVFSLRVSCTTVYPRIIEEVIGAMGTIRGSDRIGMFHRGGCIDVYSTWKHWICAFPQHGPGMKWKRRIQLHDWQREVVAGNEEDLLRGLVHSDGCRHINTVRRPTRDGVKTYRYPRYIFTNASEDILGLLTSACDELGIAWTRSNRRHIAVSTKEAVAALDGFIGPKR